MSLSVLSRCFHEILEPPRHITWEFIKKKQQPMFSSLAQIVVATWSAAPMNVNNNLNMIYDAVIIWLRKFLHCTPGVPYLGSCVLWCFYNSCVVHTFVYPLHSGGLQTVLSGFSYREFCFASAMILVYSSFVQFSLFCPFS